jgi:integrase
MKPVKDKDREVELVVKLHEMKPKYRILWLLGTHTGLRVSDILGLRVKDFKKQFDVVEAKTKKTQRIQIPDDLLLAVRLYVHRERLRPTDFIIPGRTPEKSLHRSQAWRVLHRISHEVGLDGVATHSMRKTYASDLFARTGDLHAVQKALNHKYPSTTATYLGKRMVFVDAE